MRYDALENGGTQVPLSDVPDHGVIALFDLINDLPVIRGKGAPREIVGGAMVTTERMSTSLTLANYVNEGRVLWVGTVAAKAPATATKTANVATVEASGRSAAVKVSKTATKTAKPSASDTKVGTAIAAMLRKTADDIDRLLS